MKKTVLIIFCISLFSSCLKKLGYQPPTTMVTYSFNTGKDMDGLFDFTATYTDKDNQTVKERITDLPWSKQIAATPPFDAHIEVDFSAKDHFPDQATYEVGFKGLIEQLNSGKSVANTMRPKTDDGKLRFSVTLPPGGGT